jgi:predicted GTPase
MPYGDWSPKSPALCTIGDLQKISMHIEEMEEYEPHVVRGNVIYAGVDYAAILAAAECDPVAAM